MEIPFVYRNPTNNEVERLRLILSTYQDGSGQQSLKRGGTLPGWRDFERAVALAFGGQAQESKFIFDILFADPNRPGINIGISCKMRRTLSDTFNTGRVTLELSNSSGIFWKELGFLGISQQNYKNNPGKVGESLISVVNKWHHQVGTHAGGCVDLRRSYYFALSWNKAGQYQLFKFTIELPRPETIEWDFPIVKDKNGVERLSRRLRGRDGLDTIFEWYGESGGQLKYYPLVENSLWKSVIFYLEPLPEDWTIRHGILIKARDYFPERWMDISRREECHE